MMLVQGRTCSVASLLTETRHEFDVVEVRISVKAEALEEDLFSQGVQMRRRLCCIV